MSRLSQTATEREGRWGAEVLLWSWMRYNVCQCQTSTQTRRSVGCRGASLNLNEAATYWLSVKRSRSTEPVHKIKFAISRLMTFAMSSSQTRKKWGKRYFSDPEWGGYIAISSWDTHLCSRNHPEMSRLTTFAMSNCHQTRRKVESRGASLILNGAATSQEKSLHTVMSRTGAPCRCNWMDAESSRLATFA